MRIKVVLFFEWKKIWYITGNSAKPEQFCKTEAMEKDQILSPLSFTMNISIDSIHYYYFLLLSTQAYSGTI